MILPLTQNYVSGIPSATYLNLEGLLVWTGLFLRQSPLAVLGTHHLLSVEDRFWFSVPLG
jgi:hypothetical protein